MSNHQELIYHADFVLKNWPDPVFILGLDNEVFWMNDRFRKKFGSDEAEWDNRLTHIIRVDKEKETSAIVHCYDGSIVDFDRQLFPIYNHSGEIIAYTGILKENKRLASLDDLLTGDEKYKIAAANTSDVIILLDRAGIVRYVSPSVQNILGYPVEEFEGHDAFGPVHPDDREYVMRSNDGAITAKSPIELEYRVVHALGHTIHVETRVKPVLNRTGEVVFIVAVVRDITKRKNAEQLLENILDSINAAVFSTDKDFSFYTYCSESIEKISGIPRQEIIFRPIRLHDHIHPDDNAVLMGEVKEKLDKGIPVNQIIRFIHIEGQTKWVRLIMHPYLNNEGQVERLDGLLLDITDRKRSELALEESEQRYKSLFENNLDGVFSMDLRGYLVSANDVFENITGIQLDVLPDRCFIGLIHDEDHMTVCQVISEVMVNQAPRDVECRMVRPLQNEKIVSITFVPIFLFGELNGVHGIVKDITERKKGELELIQSEKRYKELQQSINRFSNDLSNVMKVADLENRLIEEVREVLPVRNVSIVEIPHTQDMPFNRLNEKWIKIGDKDHQSYLKIEMDQKLQRLEEEWLETAVHYVKILYDNLQLIEDLMTRLEDLVAHNQTPKWMLKLLFRLSEKERASLSSDLHDTVLQDLIIWYRKLELMTSTHIFSEETKDGLVQIQEGLLDAIHQIRITCNELCPPFLLKMGLVESLQSLFTYSRMFANYEIEFSSSNNITDLNEDQILGLYRIVQELLNNASKHSKASTVKMELAATREHIHFSYVDNGVGVDLSAFDGSFEHMGIAGMKNRVLSLEGEIEIKSSPHEGFEVEIYIPTTQKQKGDVYENTAG
ncbi:MAG: PAS domain S-box protein [Tuberibacillus sp.]